ncbi:MAG: patatin family protein [Acidobacteria bacterium]|nr:MAG: patatin family protein [Acidobacteriota bacterium]
MATITTAEGRTEGKVGLALAGGGPQGALYEIGAIRALEEALEGIDFCDLDVYVGVSAGAVIGSILANGVGTARLCRAAIDPGPANPFHFRTFYSPAFEEFGRRSLGIPRLLLQSLLTFISNPRDLNLVDSLLPLSRALPIGVFSNEPLREFLEDAFNRSGRTDDFRRLDKHLIVVAADLDSGEPVRFGEPGFDHIPISKAVQASTALPGLYAPVKIEGRHYVDGVLLKTMHGSVALDAGAELLLCFNPLVPVDTSSAVDEGFMRRGKLIDRGLPTVLSQSLRTMIRSRLEAGLSSYENVFPEADVILLEPPRDDYKMFFTNVFSLSTRRAACEHAYNVTRRQLFNRREELAPVLAQHGIRLRTEFLEQENVDLWCQVGARMTEGDSVLDDLDCTLSRLEALLNEST